MIENLVLVLGLIAIGSLAKRSGHLPEGSSNILNAFVLNISLPAMILVSIPKLKIGGEVLFPIVIHWTMLAIHLLILWGVSKWMKFSKTVFGVLVIVTCLGNTAFLGIPVVKTFLGIDAVPYAVLYDQLGSGIAFILMGSFVLPAFTGGEKKTGKDILMHLLKFPPFVSLVGGFLLMIVPIPSAVNGLLKGISATLIPCAMIAVGFQMKYKMSAGKLMPLTVGLWIKLLIIPLITLGLVKLSGFSHTALNVSVLQSGMPPMVTAGAMAMAADLEPELAASLVGYGLLISFVTLSALQILL